MFFSHDVFYLLLFSLNMYEHFIDSITEKMEWNGSFLPGSSCLRNKVSSFKAATNSGENQELEL